MKKNKPALIWTFLVLFCLGWRGLSAPLLALLQIPAPLGVALVDAVVCGIFALDLYLFLRLKITFPDLLDHADQGDHAPHGANNAPKDLKQLLKAKGPYRHSPLYICADILALVPWDVLTYFLQISFPAMMFLRLLALIKIPKIARFLNGSNDLGLLPNIYKLLLCALFAGLFVHWVASIWILVQPPPTDEHFITTYNKAYYWTITTLATVGYGDITPQNNISRIYATLIMVLGISCYGILFGQISHVVLMTDKHLEAGREKWQELKNFMHHYHIPHHLQDQIFTYYHKYMRKRFSDNDQQIIADLPMALQKELTVYMKLKLIVHNHLFKILNKEGQIMVANTLEHISFSPGEFIIKRKDMGNEMFFIAHGTVEVLREDKVVLAQLLDGQFFGEIALLRDTERTADVVAKSYCDLYKLERQHLLPIMEAYPHLVEHLNEVINRRVGDRRGPNNNNSNNNSNNNGSDSPTKPSDLKKAA